MKLIITIDTEEDNWARYDTTDNPVENIKRVAVLQKLFDQYNIRPTYLVSYPVATNPHSVGILRQILADGKCEIGMHCHPWNTPPFEEEISDINSMLSNLPESLVWKKLKVLHEAIGENFDTVPVSFRAGRWGFRASVARSLCKLGYRVDTSVTPFLNWREYHGPDFSDFHMSPYRFDPNDIAVPNNKGALLEIPVTIGFLQKNIERCRRWTNYAEMNIGKKLHLKGILDRLGLLNKVWLSPELADTKSMIKLAERVESMNVPCLNMSFHSTSLMAGLSPLVASRKEEALFMEKMKGFLTHAVESGWKSILLKEFATKP